MSLQALHTQASDELASKRSALKAAADSAATLPADKVWDHVKSMEPMEREVNELAERTATLQQRIVEQDRNAEAMKAQRQPVGRITSFDAAAPDADESAIKSLADVLTGNESLQAAIKSGRKFRGELGSVSMKTLLQTSTLSPQYERLSGIVPYAVEARTTADLMLQGTTSAQVVEYYKLTTFTNAAATVAEAGIKPEAALAFTLASATVRKIATWVPVTDEMMADNEGFESFLRGQLSFMVKQTEEVQILTGDGTGTNLLGVVNQSGIQTQARGADPVPDAIFKAITKVRNTAYAEPTDIVLHPNDWQDIRLLRTADGIYIWGSPQDGGGERIWGLPVRVTSNMTQNTGLVGAFRPYAQIFRKQEIQLAVSDSHDVFFVANKLAVRAEERLALAVFRPDAFCTVTGI